ncbi:MAG: lipopolysaccharide assembly protein LapB [Wenzhouxiangellaceae bacterium]|nr:lipopolysaccharide assembly protein LapB [Wenzhouxiangellaceae bacterium]
MADAWWLAFALLPVAAWSGWAIAARQYQRGERRQRNAISSNYFRGLNYLLNEQPDKAIEVFLKLAEINQDTVETHLALGNLFRRRGEVDKAIRFHRHIMSRSSLSEHHRTQALRELGEDYMRAGLLDRAEKLYCELAEDEAHSEDAVRNLLSIYQQEKDWRSAIAQAERLSGITDFDSATLVAQFKCELAVRAWEQGDADGARNLLGESRSINPKCVRSFLLEAQFAAGQGDWSAAAGAWQAACEQDPDIAVLVIDNLSRCYAELGREQTLLEWLERLSERGSTLAPALAYATIRAHDDADGAIEFLHERLERRPTARGVSHLLELMREYAGSRDSIEPELVRRLLSKLLEGQPRFRCGQCGFSGHTWHWQCPSCRNWETTRPITGVLGE